MKESFLSVKQRAENEIIIEKSKFICTVCPVKNDDEAKLFVAEIKSKYPDATHNCYAFIADKDGFFVKFSDDGEPQGTAGLPILEVLKNLNLFCTAVVVTRYFGGIKLGTGGLCRAYTESTVKALEKAGYVQSVYSKIIDVKTPYTPYSKVSKFLTEVKSKIIDTRYENEGVAITVALPYNSAEKTAEKIVDITLGKCQISSVSEDYVCY